MSRIHDISRRSHPGSAPSKAAASRSTASSSRSTDALPEVRVGGRPARVVLAVADRLVDRRAAGHRRRRPRGRAHRRRATARRRAVRRHRGAVRHRPAPGGQPGVRSRRQPLRHLQRHPRAAGAGVDLPRPPGRHAREPSRRRSSTRRRWRSTADGRIYVSSRFEGTVYRVATDGTAEQFATDLGVACGLAFAADGTLFVGDRSGTIFRVDRRAARRRRSRRCRRASRRFTWRSAPTSRCMSPARRWRPTTRSTASTRRRGERSATPGVRPAAGAGLRSRPARCSSSKRWPGRAACTASPPSGAPELVLAGPGPGRRRVRPERRAGRLHQRHGLSAAAHA